MDSWIAADHHSPLQILLKRAVAARGEGSFSGMLVGVDGWVRVKMEDEESIELGVHHKDSSPLLS